MTCCDVSDEGFDGEWGSDDAFLKQIVSNFAKKSVLIQ